MKNKFIWLLRFLIGGTFILSAVSKLFPIEAFDLFLVNQGLANWTLAPYFSRLLITVELFLGISFFITPFVKKISIPFSFLLLTAFSIHLIILILSGSGSKNCGCFGELIPMSSVEALIKNIILIFLLYLLNKNFTYDKKLNYSSVFAVFALVLAGVFLIFQIKPYDIQTKEETQIDIVDSSQVKIEDIEKPDKTLEQTRIDSPQTLVKNEIEEKKKEPKRTVSEFSSFREFSDGTVVNLDAGIKLVCLFSLECEDCMETAYKLGQAKKDWKNFPPLYILFLGSEDQVNNFFDAAAITFPYKIVSPQTFFPLIKNYPPRIVLLNNGNIIGDWGYENFSLEELKKKLEPQQ